MSKINWFSTVSSKYQVGVDQGVLYAPTGVPWYGLISVNEKVDGGSQKEYYIDGQQYLNLRSSEKYSATIKAFSMPKEFDPCDGRKEVANGLLVTGQPRLSFGFSYRTKLIGDSESYKLHIVYNALASPFDRTFSTDTNSSDPTVFDINLTTLAPVLSGYKPTAHFEIDLSVTPEGLKTAIEDILYGTETSEPRLPPVSELDTLFRTWV